MINKNFALFLLLLFVGFTQGFTRNKINIDNFIPRIPLQFEKSNLDGIDSIFCINLNRRPQKWERMQSIFKPFNLNIKRFQAIDGWQLTNTEKFRKCCCFSNVNKPLTKGEIGTYLSHYFLWKQALNHSLSTLWILEDDVAISENPHTISRALETLNNVDPDWDLLYTDSYFWNNEYYLDTKDRKVRVPTVETQLKRHVPPNRLYPKVRDFNSYVGETPINEHIKRVNGRWGLHSVIYSQKGLKKLVEHFKKVQIILPVDAEIFLVPGLRMYSVTKDIVGQYFSNKISDTRSGP